MKKKIKREKHLSRFCLHPGSYELGNGQKAQGWCKYCRLKTFDGVKYQELKAIVMADRTKKITIENYPTTFEFTITDVLPEFVTSGTVGVDYEVELCEIRNTLLHKHMRRLKVASPCHAYEDYIVELVTPTEDGEIWQLGS